MPNKKHEQEQVYESLGFDVGNADENTYMQKRKQAEQDELVAQKEAEDVSGVKVRWETSNKDENGNRLELPARLAYEDSKVNVGRLPVWYLNALGSMNENELNDFIRTYNEDLSINEIIAINLLRGAKGGKKEDVDRFWNIQMKMLNKTNVQMNFNMAQKPDAVVTNLLDDIANKIKNASEGNIVDTPTP